MINASRDNPKRVEELEERLDELNTEFANRPPLRPEDFSPSPPSNVSQETLTDNIGHQINLNSPGESSSEKSPAESPEDNYKEGNSPEKTNPTEDNKRKHAQDEEGTEPEAKKFKQDSSGISVDDSPPQFGDVTEGGKTYIKEDFEQKSNENSSVIGDQAGQPSGSNDPVGTGTPEGTSDKGNKPFKQDTSDITSDGEPTSLFDLDGGE
jgi:hypothetical protein